MTTETKMPELLPCPCCESRAELRQVPHTDGDDNAGGYYVECTNAMCGISTQLRFSCGDDARPLLVETWNRRASPSPPADVQDGVDAVDGLTSKQAWWAGVRVGLGVDPSMPRTEVAELLSKNRAIDSAKGKP